MDGALRSADCSIVMAEGDPATRQIAKLTQGLSLRTFLEILFEGRRVVTNIAFNIAIDFPIKTVYSFLLGLICIASIVFGKAEYPLVFPFYSSSDDLAGQLSKVFHHLFLTLERNIRPC